MRVVHGEHHLLAFLSGLTPTLELPLLGIEGPAIAIVAGLGRPGGQGLSLIHI